MSKQGQYTNNLLYFEAPSMRELYDCLKSWQDENRQGFFRLNIQQDGDKFCCIALLSPGLFVREVAKTEYEEAMARFERKALRVIVKERNIATIVEFAHPIIPGQKILAIQKRLMGCSTAMEINEVFKEEF